MLSNRVWGSPQPKKNLVQTKAIRKPPVAIIFNILSTIFYVFKEINSRWCRHNTVRCHISGEYTVIDGLTPSPKGGGAARPPSNPPL